jgi:hypothetical protein
MKRITYRILAAILFAVAFIPDRDYAAHIGTVVVSVVATICLLVSMDPKQ